MIETLPKLSPAQSLLLAAAHRDDGRVIPPDTLRKLVSYKRQLIEEARGQLLHICNAQGMPESPSLTYYGTESDWLTQQDATAVQWKPHCMAMAALAEEFPVIELVLFDNNAYQSWLDGRLDSQWMRDQWASVVTQ